MLDRGWIGYGRLLGWNPDGVAFGLDLDCGRFGLRFFWIRFALIWGCIGVELGLECGVLVWYRCGIGMIWAWEQYLHELVCYWYGTDMASVWC